MVTRSNVYGRILAYKLILFPILRHEEKKERGFRYLQSGMSLDICVLRRASDIL